MAKGILSTKSRTPQSTTAISSPVFERSDAQPRNDLHDLNIGPTKNRPAHQAHWDFQRPRTAEGYQQNKKPQANGSGFDFRIAVPPVDAVPSPVESEKGHGENLIGIALGSPRMVETQNVMSQMQEKAMSTASETKRPPPIQRKPSKWKKIGGLFRAKSAITSSTNQPFYQVRSDSEWPLQGSSHSVDYQAQPKSEPRAKPISNTEVWPCLESDSQPDHKIKEKSSQKIKGNCDGPRTSPKSSSKNKPKNRKNSSSNSPPSNTQSPEQMKPNLGPLLQVDIPDVQMERYSVMFGGLLGKDQPSQPDRRSKTMENIEVPKTQVGRSFLRLQWASSTNAFNRIHHPLQSFPRLRDGQRHHRHHARNLRPLALPCSRTPKSAKPPKSWALRIYPEAQALYTGAKPPWPKHVEAAPQLSRITSCLWYRALQQSLRLMVLKIQYHLSYRPRLSAQMMKHSCCKDSSQSEATWIQRGNRNGRSSTRNRQPTSQSQNWPSRLPSTPRSCHQSQPTMTRHRHHRS